MLSSFLRFCVLLVCCLSFSVTDVTFAADEKPTPPPTAGLTPNERTFVRNLERRLGTKLQGKDNPGDRNTWYVLMFQDVAHAQIKTKSATAQPGVIMLQSGERKQSKVAADAVLVQGRTVAAIAIARFLFSPNAAAGQIDINAPQIKSGHLGGSKGNLTTNRDWAFQAFATKAEAEAFLKTVKPEEQR